MVAEIGSAEIIDPVYAPSPSTDASPSEHRTT